MYENVIKLVSEAKVVDVYGGLTVTETERSVYATLASIGQSEFYQAQAVGLKPEIKFILSNALDYQQEKKLKFQPFGATEEETYTVIRTFQKGDKLELTCKRGVDE